MAILLDPASYGSNPEAWLEAFREELPDDDIYLWPDAPPAEDVEFVIAVRHPPALLGTYANLRAVLAMGAGVEQYTGPDMPDVPVVRLEDPSMSNEMAAYVVHWIVHFQKRMDAYLANRAKALWRSEPYTTSREFPVGLLGFGRIGRRIGSVLHDLGFPINTWTRSPVPEPWVTSFVGSDQMPVLLRASRAVVNVLPSTPATAKILNREMFGHFEPGTLLVNIGRGATIDEPALLDALDDGRLGTAVLDVTETEPLPADSPLWRHPNVRITPHVAGFTVVGSASRLIAENIRRIRRGEEPTPLLDRSRQY